MKARTRAKAALVVSMALLLAAMSVLGACGKEVVREVIKEVPVEKEVIKEVPVERVVVKEVPKEVVKEVPVERVVEKEVVKEVPVERVVVKEVIKEVPAAKELEIRMLSGSVGTEWFITQTLWAEAISRQLGIRASTFPGGSAINYPIVNRGEADFSNTDSPTQYGALHGKAPYTEPLPNLAYCFSLTAAGGFLMARNDSSVKTVDDLLGKRIGMTAKGSGAATAGGPQMEAMGLTEEAVKKAGGALIWASYADTARMELDGTIDANWMMGTLLQSKLPPRHSSWAPIDDRFGVKFIPIPEKLIDEIVKGGGGWIKVTFPAGVYKGVTQPVAGLGLTSGLLVRGDFPADLMYQIMKVLFTNEVIGTTKSRTIYEDHGFLETAMLGTSITPMHPGAARFWEEQGVDLKARNIEVYKQ